MRNLIITAVLTAGLLLPGVSFAAFHPFGVDINNLRNDVMHNVENPSYTADELSIKTQAQELGSESRYISTSDYNVANYIFGVNLGNEDLS